jgi:hypothetical protein
MAHAVMIPSKVAANNVAAWTLPATSESADLDNGNVVSIASQSTALGQSEVWLALQPLTATLASGLYMVGEPEVVITESGTYQFKNIDPDPRNFYNKQGSVFTIFKLQVGDIVKLTADAFVGTQSTNTFIIATNASYKWTWAASAISGASLSLINDADYISIPNGSIGDQRVAAKKFRVVAI